MGSVLVKSYFSLKFDWMAVLKKIVGYFLIGVAVLLSISTLLSTMHNFFPTAQAVQRSTVEGIAYIVGTLVGTLILIVLIAILFKAGKRLIRKPAKIDSIDDIGNHT
jgi:protein-S-isoprenylcysteine O-methyltransferase Ste14